MSASNKTANLGLNSWLGSDRPQRSDFNSDNEKIDSYFSEHSSNMEMHLSESDREKLIEPYYIGSYIGNGNSTRELALECSFEPSFGIIFCLNNPMGITQFDQKKHSNYSAFVSQRGSTLGAKLEGKNLTVTYYMSASVESECEGLNVSGRTYFYIMFR